MRYPVGAKVVMSPVGKREYEDALNNSHSAIGTVISYWDKFDYSEESFIYRVDWSDKPSNNNWTTINRYRHKDLTPVVLDKELEDYL